MKAKISKLCQLANLRSDAATEKVAAHVQESELGEVGNSSWYRSIESVGVEVEAGKIRK